MGRLRMPNFPCGCRPTATPNIGKLGVVPIDQKRRVCLKHRIMYEFRWVAEPKKLSDEEVHKIRNSYIRTRRSKK